MTVRAPFPWFGGKSRAAHLVWDRFGDVPNYVEPFAGSLAVLLGRPTPARIETVNDADAFICNFWRAVTADPEAVAHYADWPVNEADLHARHRWLVNQIEFREHMKTDPDFFDAKIAGWWVWGICQWIGSGWCSATTLPSEPSGTELAHAGSRWKVRGVNADGLEGKRPSLTSKGGVHRSERLKGLHEKRPDLKRGVGRGVHRKFSEQIPQLRGDSGAAGAGIHSSGLKQQIPFLNRDGMGVLTARQLPDLGGKGIPGKGIHAGALGKKMPRIDRGTVSRMSAKGDAILAWMSELQDRLRNVRVCCGDWTRVLGRSATECIGVTGVFLDPPYGADADRDPSIYNHDDLEVAGAVRAWAIGAGDNPMLRIALCGYEGEHDMPDTWECVAWKANGGYAAAAGNNENAAKERIWFSPHCLRPQGMLFAR